MMGTAVKMLVAVTRLRSASRPSIEITSNPQTPASRTVVCAKNVGTPKNKNDVIVAPTSVATPTSTKSSLAGFQVSKYGNAAF